MADKSFGVDQLDILGTGTPTISAPNQLNLECNTVAISTSVTVGQNLTVSANAGIASLNVTGIATVVNFNATGISTIASPSDTNSHSRWKVSNNGSSAYRFTGPGQDGSEDNPNVYLVRGQRYIFDVNASGHPFQLRVANGGAAYSDGVTNNGAQSGQVIFNVQHDAPAQLYYQCTNHGSMVGNIYIVGGPQVISGVLTATSFSGSGANLTSLPAQATIANNADNRVITGGSGVNLNGEANLTFDGSKLTVSSTLPEIFLTDTNTSNARGRLNANGGGLLLGADNDNAAANSVISFAVDGSEKSRIDSSGRLLLGTTTEGEASADNLTIADSGNSGISIRSGTSSWGSIFFSDATSGTGELSGAIEYKHNDNYMRFRTNGDERLRIESGGDVDIKNGVLKLASGANRRLFYRSGNNDVILEADSGDFYRQDIANSTHEFFTGNTERLRITAGGVVEVKTVGGAATFRIRSGGDQEIYAANNTDKVTLFCDHNNQLTIAEKLRFTNTSGGILRSDGKHALKPTGGCIQTKVTYRNSKFTNSSNSYQVVHSHDFTVESGNLIAMHFDADMNADTSPTSWQMMGLRIGSTFYSEKIIEHSSGQNMNASASGLTGAMSAGNHAVQLVTRNGGGQCSYNEGNTGTGIVLHTYEYVA